LLLFIGYKVLEMIEILLPKCVLFLTDFEYKRAIRRGKAILRARRRKPREELMAARADLERAKRLGFVPEV